MGQSKRRKDAIFQKQSTCIFCGGSSLATTIEHCPPRAMFQEKVWPEGFEFPACSTCNNGSSDQDLLVAMLARCGLDDKGNGDGRLPGVMAAVHQQFPSLIEKMLPSASEARKMNRELGISPSAGETHQEASPVKVTEEMHEAIEVFSSKLAKGIFFLETGRVFPTEGKLALNWFSNIGLVQDGYYKVFELLAGVSGVSKNVERNRQPLTDQFTYKFSPVTDADMFLLQAQFGRAFGLVVIAAAQRERLDSMMEGFQQRHGHEGPFKIL
jgi:hypothetical protein